MNKINELKEHKLNRTKQAGSKRPDSKTHTTKPRQNKYRNWFYLSLTTPDWPQMNPGPVARSTQPVVGQGSGGFTM